MAIDKSSGFLAYAETGHIHLMFPLVPCWFVLDSMTNYTTGDLLYFNKDGNFYVLPNALCGDLEVWRLQGRICSKEAEINAIFPDDEHHNSCHHIHAYLVESLDGNILLVRRYVIQEDYSDSSCSDNSFKTDSFKVFKLNFKSKQWEVVPRLGTDESLFVGSNSAFALSSTKYPEVIPNCIYFTDQLCHHGGDMLHGNDNGIFHLQDCTFTTLFSDDFKCTNGQPPIWLRPDERPWRFAADSNPDADDSKSS